MKIDHDKVKEVIARAGELNEDELDAMLFLVTREKSNDIVYVGKSANIPPYDKQNLPFVSVTKQGSFDAAHNNPELGGKCAFLHGHTYYYEVSVRGHVNPTNGTTCDFRHLKKIMQEQIEAKLDHKYLNDVLPFVTSAEHVCIWIYNTMKDHLPGVYKVKLSENQTSFVEVTEEDFR